jgi:hypothetical protein
MNLKEKINGLFHGTPEKKNPTEEIKNTTEIETSPEEEISPERIETLKEYDKETLEITSLKKDDLKDSIENPEEREALGEKLSTLAKIAEILKDHAPEIAIAAVGLASLAFGLTHSTAEMVDSAVMSADKISVMVASAVSAVAAVFSPLLWSYKNFNKKEAFQTQEINNNSHEAIAA